MKIKLTLFLFTVSLIFSPGAYADYKIENVSGNIYRFIDDRHRSVFAVTSEGIILTDPLNPKAAPKIYRGDTIELNDYEEKGNEVRPKKK